MRCWAARETRDRAATDPLGLAQWYAETFGLTAQKHVVRGPGVLIAFKQGEPLGRSGDDLHMGFRVQSLDSLSTWATKFGAKPVAGPEFTTFRVTDPEGNGIEFYTPSR